MTAAAAAAAAAVVDKQGTFFYDAASVDNRKCGYHGQWLHVRVVVVGCVVAFVVAIIVVVVACRLFGASLRRRRQGLPHGQGILYLRGGCVPARRRALVC